MVQQLQVTVVRKNEREIRRLIRETFGALGSTRGAPDPNRVRRVFLQHFIHSLVGSIHKGFMDKSRPGGRDDLGTSWKRLKLSTIKAKLRKRAKVRQQIAESLLHGAFQGSTRQLREKADVLAAQMVPIGIDSGELEKSYRQGKLTKDRYYPPHRTQKVVFEEKSVQLSSNVPHAAHFHRVRPIYPGPRKMRPWTLRAVQAGLNGVLDFLMRAMQR